MRKSNSSSRRLATTDFAVQGTIALDPDGGPWLIRSHYWNCWHRLRNGGAGGYTDDIAHAGVFDYAVAHSYNDFAAGGRDEAVPVARALSELEERLAALTDEQTALSAVVGKARLLLSDGGEAVKASLPDDATGAPATEGMDTKPPPNLRAMARARYEARDPWPLLGGRWATWEEACEMPGWEDQEIAAMAKAVEAGGG